MKHYFLIISMFFFGCNKNLFVDEIEHGKHLDKAIEINSNEFLEKRMKNRLRKANVGNYDILYESADYIFIGKPRLNNLISGKRIVDTLYKIDFESLKKELPSYKQIEGFKIRQKIYSGIQTYMKSNQDTIGFYLDYDFRSSVSNNLLIIEFPVLYNNNQKENFLANFDLESLELMNHTKK